ncbi:MAG: hypothetical protein J6P94_00845 [Oscillospiraceae bacterium]|nr:hypothetical protein [Oscillospiraceae bacterium]
MVVLPPINYKSKYYCYYSMLIVWKRPKNGRLSIENKEKSFTQWGGEKPQSYKIKSTAKLMHIGCGKYPREIVERNLF